MADSFFATIPAFKDFSEIGQGSHYVPAPDDWWVVVTDVTNSTEAVNSGSYRKVNIAGAAAIAALKNLCKGIELPFAFGGDGCTVMIPPQCVEAAKAELLKVKSLCQMSFGLGLRVGLVAIKDLRTQGKDIKVARYALSEGASLASFIGGGTRLAEDLLKQGSCELKSTETSGSPDTEGLSCRWEPLLPQKGKMMALMVLARGDDAAIYQQVIRQVKSICADAKPVSAKNLKFKWPPQGMLIEAKLSGGFLPLKLLKIFGFTALVYWLTKNNKTAGDYDPALYQRDVVLNADYQKFDDMLRMVIDCSSADIQKIREYLTGLKDKNLIFFGTHEADSALMTCLVSSLKSDGHVHFIDAADGGYAFAAREMKEQMKAALV